MLIPSFYRSAQPERSWKVGHAALYGAVIGALAALFKTFGPLGGGPLTHRLAELVAASAAFALLCAAAAMLRNTLASRLIWREDR